MLEKIESVLNKYVRPLLLTHGGDIQVLDFKNGVVRFRFLGKCSGCPASDLTAEELVQSELRERIPEVRKAVLVQDVSEDLINYARSLLRQRHK